MLKLRTAFIALALATSGVAVTTLPASAGASISVEINNRDRDRYYHDDYRYDRGHHRGHYNKWRKARNYCYTDYDVRYRFGQRVRVVKQICFNRYGRPYVANRRYVRIGSRW